MVAGSEDSKHWPKKISFLINIGHSHNSMIFSQNLSELKF